MLSLTRVDEKRSATKIRVTLPPEAITHSRSRNAELEAERTQLAAQVEERAQQVTGRWLTLMGVLHKHSMDERYSLNGHQEKQTCLL